MYEYMNMTFFHGIGMIVFWAIIFFLVVTIFLKNTTNSNEHALDILKKRLAKGEISKEEFNSLKELIG
jgi:putative membrane protein